MKEQPETLEQKKDRYIKEQKEKEALGGVAPTPEPVIEENTEQTAAPEIKDEAHSATEEPAPETKPLEDVQTEELLDENLVLKEQSVILASIHTKILKRIENELDGDSALDFENITLLMEVYETFIECDCDINIMED